MHTTIWIIAAIAIAVLAVGVVRAARRNHRAFAPAIPATISVTEPTVDTLESPRHAAVTDPAAVADITEITGVTDVPGGAHRRAS